MLKGKELEGKFGNVGAYEVDVEADGMVNVQMSATHPDLKNSRAGAFLQLDIVEVLEVLCKRTDTQIDDTIVSMVKSALGRK